MSGVTSFQIIAQCKLCYRVSQPCLLEHGWVPCSCVVLVVLPNLRVRVGSPCSGMGRGWGGDGAIWTRVASSFCIFFTADDTAGGRSKPRTTNSLKSSTSADRLLFAALCSHCVRVKLLTPTEKSTSVLKKNVLFLNEIWHLYHFSSSFF